jgi:hypothetical protein
MKLKLVDLEPHFLQRTSRFAYQHTDDIAAAEGLTLLCPACYWSNSGRPGTHPSMLWPIAGRWGFSGTGYADLTLAAPSASVSIIGGCRAHFYIRRGRVDFC